MHDKYKTSSSFIFLTEPTTFMIRRIVQIIKSCQNNKRLYIIFSPKRTFIALEVLKEANVFWILLNNEIKIF